MNVRVFTTALTNPWFNLATEEWMFRELPADTVALFLWRNSDSIILGRHQDAFAECKVEKLKKDKVMLARRHTGGGAVFHDLGNTNFTLLTPKANFDVNENIRIIINALATFGLNATMSGRNDIQIADKKVSGTAFKFGTDRVLHHGTMLVNADLNKLGYYLTPNPLKLKDKKITSVTARVANLSEFVPDITNDKLCQAVIDAFCDHYQCNVTPEALDHSTLNDNAFFRAEHQKLASEAWIFNQSPDAKYQWFQKFSWGLVNINVNEDEHDNISMIKVFSDALDVEFIEAMNLALRGQPFNPFGFTMGLDAVAAKNPSWSPYIEEVLKWLTEEYNKL